MDKKSTFDLLVLGNGFDLNHNLPTTYLSFINVTDFLVNNSLSSDMTIGSIFNVLSKKCDSIKKLVDANLQYYNEILINISECGSLADMCRNNLWWNYFHICCQNDISWIGFEKEIAIVLEEFDEFFKTINSISFNCNKYPIVDSFAPLFCEKDPEFSYYKINEIYLNNDAFHKEKHLIKKEKITKSLYDELENFSKAFEKYLKLFVDDVLDLIPNKESKRYELFDIADRVISFNYTSTYEKYYCTHSDTNKTIHIHGKNGEGIILGINPDNNDEAGGDTVFIDFKKYYQRHLYDKAAEYIRISNYLSNYSKIEIGDRKLISVTVFGHSLDITDEDIIKRLFCSADEITVYHHNIEAKKLYMKNLIKIFGKTEFEKLIENRHLKFQPQKD